MPPTPILSVDQIDCDRLIRTRDEIYERIPQRHEFALLDGIVNFDPEAKTAVAYHDVRPDAWWCRGHMPGRPIFPGVLMLECAAQLAAFYRELVRPSEPGQFMGFGGVDAAKFRGAVVPPSRLVLVGKSIEERPRRFVCDVQGYVDRAMVFEARISGMPVRP